jgi:hypothetical protein
MKIPIVLTMIACLLVPQQIRSQSGPPPGKKNTLIVGCIVIAVGGIIYVGLSSLCKHIEDSTLEPPPPPVTNQPLTRVNWTNSFPPWWRGSFPPPGYVSPRGRFQDNTVVHVSSLDGKASLGGIAFDIARWEHSPFSDPRPPLVTNGVFDSYYSLTLESSTNLFHWVAVCQSFVYECHSTNFMFEDGTGSGVVAVLVNTYLGRYDAVTNAVPIFSGYHSQADGVCALPPDCVLLEGTKPQEFFRWVQ